MTAVNQTARATKRRRQWTLAVVGFVAACDMLLLVGSVLAFSSNDQMTRGQTQVVELQAQRLVALLAVLLVAFGCDQMMTGSPRRWAGRACVVAAAVFVFVI